MAAHDYYRQNSYYTNPQDDYARFGYRTDAPLPPLPPSAQSQSPFNDTTYPYKHPTPSQSYAGSQGRIHDDADPFEDENAIPMSGRRPKHDSSATIQPILPHQQEDPFVRDADPHKHRRRRRRGDKEKSGWFSGKITWVVYILSAIELVVFLAEIIKNAVLTGSPIEIHPSFNPMIGPSPYVLINMGARYPACMHNMPNVQNASVEISWPCPNATSTTGDSVTCSLSDLCGFNGVPNPHAGGSPTDQPAPNQWWRFIIPIFLHAGIIHIGFNLLLQLTLGRDVEKLIGSVRFAIVYMAAGIFGFVLGGNYAANGIASCGCSGSLFGILAITLLDLLYTWKQRKSPIKDLLFIIADVVIAFVLGLLPGLDNFSHIGGFLMGLVLGVCILRSPAVIASRKLSAADDYHGSSTARYSGLPPATNPSSPSQREEGLKGFLRAPLTFFQNRKSVWWSWWLVRAAALIACLVGFILLIENFYKEDANRCSWCKYLSCLPVSVGGENWCDVGNLNFTPTNGTGGGGNSRRDGGFLGGGSGGGEEGSMMGLGMGMVGIPL
ncbi:rhomboid-domain-containing protein [Hortaea werneckii]|uniref:Rhomboid-type serine protease n=1 Tax=Hortaea werneckii TaxID=91943 RepID=A0A3M7I8C5_HORWE|nr:rhomboid-domain-containing protein [Hortaea werneckii]KAI6821565.1 rhomboid-domain-containing protein [Hortaea werneckii]KAI6918389.1 rhomboid-domain-containing protein [Hortaea werneckii]KAI6929017.1 rhomboid-domain-containing protein [Hortaea werneckii]KAI6964359.1 rhomboid-domain-containing protein [Hortaea werneckii]